MWKFAYIGFEGDRFAIDGLDVPGADWRSTGDRVSLPHPAHAAQMHNFSVYEFGDRATPFRMAVAELSAGVYGFYVPA